MSTGHQFMVNTRYEFLGESDQSQGLPHPHFELPVDPSASLIPLPAPDSLDLEPMDVYALLTDRVTRRTYADDPLSLAELSFLLWTTQGIKPVEIQHITRRTVPSAGSRHAFETLLLVNNVEELEPGLYRYVASAHALLRLDAPDNIAEQVTQACLNQNQVRTSAVTFAWFAVAYRMTYRYGERGYRYLHLDAGHVCQNLYLAAEAVACGVCAIAAFNDEALNAALVLDGEDQFVVYVATVGKRR
ncbi:MAG: SagB/ThcOx family dehydrogenase [Chloroflexi bacterium]|nr:SagB/ThcOx family dehydrogenase [Chloroflexota bacterium]